MDIIIESIIGGILTILIGAIAFMQRNAVKKEEIAEFVTKEELRIYKEGWEKMCTSTVMHLAEDLNRAHSKIEANHDKFEGFKDETIKAIAELPGIVRELKKINEALNGKERT